MQKTSSDAISSSEQPFLRWAGSKRRILSRLSEFWGSGYNRYVEPFAGSSALYFHLAPSSALLSDINEALIHTYLVLRTSPSKLHQSISSYPSTETAYYKARNLSPAGLTDLGRATRFLYLNRHCFNGIYRTNKSGEFNVPYAPPKNKQSRIPPLAHLQACAKMLKTATLMACDFEKCLALVNDGDFVYLDPPYAVDSRRIFREYDPGAFSVQDLTRLGISLHKIDNVGAKFVLSYADCRQVRELGSEWSIRHIVVRRNVAGFAGARKSAREVLITNIKGV